MALSQSVSQSVRHCHRFITVHFEVAIAGSAWGLASAHVAVEDIQGFR